MQKRVLHFVLYSFILVVDDKRLNRHGFALISTRKVSPSYPLYMLLLLRTFFCWSHRNSRTRMRTLSRDLTHQWGIIMADNDWQKAAGSATRN